MVTNVTDLAGGGRPGAKFHIGGGRFKISFDGETFITDATASAKEMEAGWESLVNVEDVSVTRSTLGALNGYVVRCTLYVVRCTLYVVRCTLYGVRSTLYGVTLYDIG